MKEPRFIYQQAALDALHNHLKHIPSAMHRYAAQVAIQNAAEHLASLSGRVALTAGDITAAIASISTMQAGVKVKYAEPQDDYEKSLIMTVLEDRGERILVELPVDGFDKIKPTAVYPKSDLVLA